MPPGRGGKSLVTSRIFGTSAQLGAEEITPLAGEPVERHVQILVARTRQWRLRARGRRPDRAVEADQRSLPVALGDQPARHPRAFVGLGELLVGAVELPV